MSRVLEIGSFTKCYLVEGERGAILIDTGLYARREPLYRLVRDRGVRLIVLTHGHPDHTGCAAYLAKRLNVPIGMNAGDLPLLRGQPRRLYAQGAVGHAFRAAGRLIERPPGFVPDLHLEEGARLDVFGVSGVVHELPGHTQGSIGILVEEDKYFVGDAMVSLPRPAPARLYEDLKQMQRSHQRICQSGARMIYTGHGKGFVNPY